MTGRYRCREHPDYPVSFRGTGCPVCEHEKRQRERPKPEPDDRGRDVEWLKRNLAGR